MERARGIEPPSKAWEAFVLPLNYAREAVIAGVYRLFRIPEAMILSAQ